jgi:hypothetical protein
VSPTERLYASSSEALKAVREDFLYWTGKLTETSFQLSFGVLASNWAVFGSVDAILRNVWSQLSIFLVLASLAKSVLGAKRMGELHLKQCAYAATDPSRWNAEFEEKAHKMDPWPFTKEIESTGRLLRNARAWLPTLAGLLFVIALLRR